MSDLVKRLNYDACLSEATHNEHEHNRAKLIREAVDHIEAQAAEIVRLRALVADALEDETDYETEWNKAARAALEGGEG